jgi:NAD(P)H-dependent flavin oxidoreductase YrpB (nitropropane dioxygenase family)
VSRAELVAAVANSGAWGFIAVLTRPTAADLTKAIAAGRDLTDKPFSDDYCRRFNDSPHEETSDQCPLARLKRANKPCYDSS